MNLNNTGTHALYRGFTGSTLKIIAAMAMLFDHINKILIVPQLVHSGLGDAMLSGDYSAFLNQNGFLYLLNLLFGIIGRIAFPIFAFLIVEGFIHTRNVKRYLIQIGVIALVSEVPFDVAFSAGFVDFTYQNVMFTMLFGLFALILIRKIEETQPDMDYRYALFLKIAAGILLSIPAFLLRTDYGPAGVLTIVIFYLFRDRRVYASVLISSLLTVFFSFGEIPVFLSIPLLRRYNGLRGYPMKVFFYLFYPLHLAVLCIAAVIMVSLP